MQEAHARLLRFDGFEMDVESGELRKGGMRLKLQPQPFRLLGLLASRAGRVLTRQEIERELWGGQTHVDFEGGLNYCIRQIRTALGDDADSPRYIETLPRRGYRFLVTVETPGSTSAARPRRPMIAVLPFGNLTGQNDQDYFCDGLTEELIAQLGRLNPQQLGVIAFTTARQYRNTPKGIDQIGEELGVEFIVEGSFRRAGDRVRIMAQLIQVSDQSHLWAEAYNRTLEDIINIQIDVAERVARSLAVELLAGRGAAMARAVTRNSAAYEAYLKGRYYLNKRRTEEDFLTALGHFKKAIEKDPAYVPAYAGVADVYDVAGFYSWIAPKDAYEGSMRAIRKALELDRTYAEIYTSLAYAKMLYEWDFPGAEASFRQALDLNPNYVTAHYWYAFFLAAVARFDEALGQIDQALHLDPLSLVINSSKGRVLYFARRYEEAIVQLKNTIDMEEEFPLAHYLLGLVYLQMSRCNEAAAEFQRARETSENHPASISGVASALALSGNKSEARKVLRQLEELASRRYVTAYYSGLVYVALGENDRAFACLEKAHQDGCASLTNIKSDPGLDPLRSDHRFENLVKRVGLS
jgi:TolB-like protein/Tfp pilus assembly protein PilF